jgi:hypothetical protein
MSSFSSGSACGRLFTDNGRLPGFKDLAKLDSKARPRAPCTNIATFPSEFFSTLEQAAAVGSSWSIAIKRPAAGLAFQTRGIVLQKTTIRDCMLIAS